ncbi:hypothetical protein [Sorangium sp. So ce861]|uniref:hypothetical protein n=1 Tax=Sorangium sp. So ce861 TaxID=3133323 RepID=UPI003F62201B
MLLRWKTDIAQRNCGVPTSAWAPLAGAADHVHTAGYDFFDGSPAIALDLHGTAVAEDTLDLMASARAGRGGRPLTVTLKAHRDLDGERRAGAVEAHRVEHNAPLRPGRRRAVERRPTLTAMRRMGASSGRDPARQAT